VGLRQRASCLLPLLSGQPLRVVGPFFKGLGSPFALAHATVGRWALRPAVRQARTALLSEAEIRIGDIDPPHVRSARLATPSAVVPLWDGQVARSSSSEACRVLAPLLDWFT